MIRHLLYIIHHVTTSRSNEYPNEKPSKHKKMGINFVTLTESELR